VSRKPSSEQLVKAVPEKRREDDPTTKQLQRSLEQLNTDAYRRLTHSNGSMLPHTALEVITPPLELFNTISDKTLFTESTLLYNCLMPKRQPDGLLKTEVTPQEGSLVLKTRPDPGWAIIEGKQAATCGSEAGPKGYYQNGRAENYVNSPQKMRAAFERRVVPGLATTEGFEEDSNALLGLMNSGFHEGWGKVVRYTPDNSCPIRVMTYIPVVESRTIMGLKPCIISTNFQEGFEESGPVILLPAYVCRKHMSIDPTSGQEKTGINPETGLPYQCTKEETEDHLPKDTRGHEAPGTAVKGKIPVTLDSLVPVHSQLRRYVEEDPQRQQERETIYNFVEPLGCALEAWSRILYEMQQGVEPPASIVIWGQSINAYLNIMFVRAMVPNAKVFVVGKNQRLVEYMRLANPDINPVMTDGQSYSEVQAALKELTNRGTADVVLPTVSLPEETILPLVKAGGTVIQWAAADTESYIREGGARAVFSRYRIQKSYGGVPGAELTAMNIMAMYAKQDPIVLEGATKFPTLHHLKLEDSAPAIEQWIPNGKYVVNGMSTKIIIHM
jgi:threonine dehydrogenase-like Zn-dependent dehydrogenase